ncbi:hypothetical protein [Thermosediminibacter litoriperuensis]|uniref:Uncharacterized protein n=1 Tax=Thermosediminibacter litoriperuensis TaxID=291989 RepID=A0A5S5AZ88_9FIRM|nr:hypothetical protein [Thermosediminibacter litoriperuensis]TYP58771.1 hypothetical protein LZ11_00226 [Thermosediminibacter litoriperuensis]
MKKYTLTLISMLLVVSIFLNFVFVAQLLDIKKKEEERLLSNVFTCGEYFGIFGDNLQKYIKNRDEKYRMEMIWIYLVLKAFRYNLASTNTVFLKDLDESITPIRKLIRIIEDISLKLNRDSINTEDGKSRDFWESFARDVLKVAELLTERREKEDRVKANLPEAGRVIENLSEKYDSYLKGK